MAQVLIPVYTKKFKKQFKQLPVSLQNKFEEKLILLLTSPHHPSLRARKMAGMDRFEARLTLHYRFTYTIIANECWFLSIDPHDVGLGKK